MYTIYYNKRLITILNFDSFREARIIISIYNVYYGKAPISIQVLFITNDAIHSHSTRRNDHIRASNIKLTNFLYYSGLLCNWAIKQINTDVSCLL